jgi:alkanesulfonate monooxygenase SsuD/methylene tetrahydromethanopterin reductase-like flavin-dependent oxidoreductase (luciferase family)
VPLDLSVIVLPDVAPAEFVAQVRDAEAAGVRTAWTYDHLSWRDLRDGPWFGAVPLLAAAGARTSTIRLGTQVASPNFRHPVPFAKEVMTLDHVCGGRFELGVGAGTSAADASVLGEPTLSPRRRSERFVEWTALLARLLEEPVTDHRGEHYTAVDARNLPGCVQRPRVPITVAAAGPRALRLAARLGQGWVTYADYAGLGAAMDAVLAEHAPGEALRRIAQVGLDDAAPFADADAWAEFTAGLTAAGYHEVSVHWPRTDGRGVPAAALDLVLSAHA